MFVPTQLVFLGGRLVILGDTLHVGGGVDRLHIEDGVESSWYGPVHFSGRRGEH